MTKPIVMVTDLVLLKYNLLELMLLLFVPCIIIFLKSLYIYIYIYIYIYPLPDIDECSADDYGECQQICVNTAGSYICGCADGYRLAADNRNCEG